MLWIVTSLLASIIITFANIIDSHILSKKMPNMPTYLVPMGIAQMVIAVGFFAVFRFSSDPGITHLLAAIGSALANGISLVIMLKCLQKGEVSRVVPVAASYPIFVALLSIPILSEVLNLYQWLAIVMTVLGAVLISVHRAEGQAKAKLQGSFFLLLFAAVLTAFSSIGFKYALETMTVWNMVSINGLCVGAAALIISLRKETLAELKILPQRTQKISLIVVNQAIAITGVAVGFVATANGPIALVTTVMNIRPAFVLVFSLIISRFFPAFISERIDRRTILLKVAGIVLITGGVAIIGFTS